MSKLEKSWALVKLVVATSKRVDLKNLETKYNLTRKRKSRIHIVDAGKHWTFQLDEGHLKMLFASGTVDTDMYIKELCTLKHLRLGSKKGLHPGSGKAVSLSYAPMDAWRQGDVQTYGDASTNDVVAFLDVFLTVMKQVPSADVEKIIGKCDHDTTSKPGKVQAAEAIS